MKRLFLLLVSMCFVFVMFSQVEVVTEKTNDVIEAVSTTPVADDCNFCLEYYVLALIGMGVHLLLKWRDAYTQGESWDWKRHLIFSGIGVLTSFVVIYLREYLTIDIMGTEISVNPLTAFFIGYFADSVWKNIESGVRKKLLKE